MSVGNANEKETESLCSEMKRNENKWMQAYREGGQNTVYRHIIF